MQPLASAALIVEAESPGLTTKKWLIGTERARRGAARPARPGGVGAQRRQEHPVLAGAVDVEVGHVAGDRRGGERRVAAGLGKVVRPVRRWCRRRPCSRRRRSSCRGCCPWCTTAAARRTAVAVDLRVGDVAAAGPAVAGRVEAAGCRGCRMRRNGAACATAQRLVPPIGVDRHVLGGAPEVLRRVARVDGVERVDGMSPLMRTSSGFWPRPATEV